MAKRPRLPDIAAEAGVGVATVWRVLNERPGVRPETAARVTAAARRLGARQILPEPARPPLRLEVFLVRSESPFYRRLADAFRTAGAGLGTSVILHVSFVAENEPQALAEGIARAVDDRQGIAVYAPETPSVLAAIDAAADRGLPVVTLVTDLATARRHPHVGIDQTAAGRTAGHFLGRMMRRRAPVLILTGRQVYRAHRDRLAGCLDVLARDHPDLEVHQVVESQDDRQLTRDRAWQALSERPDIGGIYNTASANAEVADLLRRTGRAGDTVLIGHEATPETAALLRDGTMALAIDQNPELHAVRALRILMRGTAEDGRPAEGGTIPFAVICRENLPTAP